MSKTLVVYFSASGHTKAIAEQIAQHLGADLFEIQPAVAYPDADLDWTNDASRVGREYHDPSLRDVALAEVTPAGWSDYDRIIIGYPIWWGIAAWPVSSFVAQNDFSGKTIHPFAVSHSSPLGDSAKLLAETAPTNISEVAPSNSSSNPPADNNNTFASNFSTGNWASGIRFSQDAHPAEVQAWAKTL